MFPISDEHTAVRTPIMTISILVVTWVMWFFVQGAGNPMALAASVCTFGIIPGELTHLTSVGEFVPLGVVHGQRLACEITHDPVNWATPILSLFLHGSWGHIIGNSLYLWVFGHGVEDCMGRRRFLGFYLLTGVIAGLAHVAVSPSSPVPTVGASGAISGIMGAYLVLYPRVSVRIYFPPIFLFRIPAWAVLIFWFGSQLVSGLPQLRPLARDISGGVAVWAHIGGFLAGALLIKAFRNPDYVRRRQRTADGQVVWS